MSAAEPVEQDLEGFQLSVTTDKGGRPCTSVWRVGIVMRAHGKILPIYSSFIEIR
jgi:hypothetical protein